jgi:hypothetical protein
MSSSTPYKSRLLNFLNRKAIQINDKLGKTIRYVKVATEWGVQILLYPVYLMVQSGRMAGRQLAQKFQSNLFLSSGEETKEIEAKIPVDRPLEAVFMTITPWVTTNEIDNISDTESIVVSPTPDPEITNHINSIEKATTSVINSSIASHLSLQGIASIIEDRHLVLVDIENQILDILTSEQQQQLQKKIVLEVAVYKYQKRRQLLLQGREKTTYLPSYEISSNSSNIEAPARFVWELMNWIQIGQVATSLDLFGESNLVCNIVNNPSDDRIDRIFSAIDLVEIAHNLDGTLVKLEEKAILPVSNTIGSKLQTIGQNWFDRNLSRNDREEIINDPFQIKTIILAAIEYFFNDKNNKTLANNSKRNLSPTKSLPEPIEIDPWLAWEDLYLSERSPLPIKSKLPQPSPALPAATMPKKPDNSRSKKIERDLERRKTRSIQPISRKSSKLLKKTQKQSSIVPQKRDDRQHSSLQHDRDYLETKAKPVGYVKHPLEQILSWLDAFILWLEELFIAILRWFKR